VDEELKNLILAVPVIGVLTFFVRYFMEEIKEEKKISKEERRINKERDDREFEQTKQDIKIMIGISNHVEESNRKHEESNKKHEETNTKIDHIIRKLDT
jgi:hypothetical protein